MLNTKVYEAKEWQTIECSFLWQRIFLFKAFRFANYLMMSYYAPYWFPLQVFFFEINLLSNLNILRLVLVDWSCSGNIKQAFFMIPPKLCFTKSAVNKWAYIFEMPPDQTNYPWFLKRTLYLGQEKPMLINSSDMSHLSPFSHRSNSCFC